MEIVRIDDDGRSVQECLQEVVEANPDQVLVLCVADGKIYVQTSNMKNRLWVMGALCAMLVEQWTHDS